MDKDLDALTRYSAALVQAVDLVAEDWIRRSILARAPELAEDPAAEIAAQHGRAEIVAELTRLFEVDIDDQQSGPLQVLRRGVRFATEVLTQAGVAPVERDEFDQRNFVDDVYGLTPASFAEVDESLREPGIEWGAAKAHVHLRRRRAAAEVTGPQAGAVALCVDLMDRSKIQAAYPGIRLVRGADELVEAAANANPVLVDLGRFGDPEAAAAALAAVVAATDGQVIAFGSHVDTPMLDAAAEAGAEALPRSVLFRRLAERSAG